MIMNQFHFAFLTFSSLRKKFAIEIRLFIFFLVIPRRHYVVNRIIIMKLEFWISVCGVCVLGVNSFILIPDQWPFILSVLTSNVSHFKKGTDSRVGIGFRLGPNADFQVQFEIGPQNNTQPIGPNASSGTSSKKRQTPFAVPSSAQKVNHNVTNPSEKWPNIWKFNLNEDPDQNLHEPNHKSDPTRGDDNFVNQLRQLYEAGSPSNANKNETV